MYDRCQLSGTLSIYIIWLDSDVKQTVTPSPVDLIISMIIPEGPAALPDFILLFALDAISDVIFIAGPSTRASSLIFVAFIEIRHSKAFDNEIARLSTYH